MGSLTRSLDWITLFFEFLILRYVRLFWIPKITNEESVDKKVIVVTGVNGGLGKATARMLVEKGAIVVFACRNVTEGQKAIYKIKARSGAAKDKMVLMKLDLADLYSIEEFSTSLKKKFNAIHILINNAGLVNTFTGVGETTKNNFEIHMGVNHLGYFLLTNLLLDLLRKGAPSRVVTVSSHLMLLAQLKMEDLMLEKAELGKRDFIPYNNSKLANALFTLELAKRVKGQGITFYAVCPGLVTTDVFKNMSPFEKLMIKIELLFAGVSADTGSEAILFCALSKMDENQSGKVLHYNRELSLANKILQAPKNQQKAAELWEKSEQLVDLKRRLS